MEPSFWHGRWESGRLGFHEPAANPTLVRWWPTLGLPPSGRVFVPLCGKTHDLHHLASLGHSVIGAELSPIACREFFAEAGLEPTTRREGEHTRWSSGPLTILEGDVLTLSDIGPLAGFYDRAATHALPLGLRERYAHRLAALTPAGAAGLLVTLDYPQDEKQGPPFSVPPAEVERLYRPAFQVELLEESDLWATNPARYGDGWGLSRTRKNVWRLTRR